jgi:hypothetical protein
MQKTLKYEKILQTLQKIIVNIYHMKKFLLTFLIIFSCLAMSAQRYLSTAERAETTVKPAQMMTRTVETQSDGVIVTYQINAVSLTESGDEKGSVRIGLDGFGSGSILGEPALPSRLDAFAIPSGYTASIDIISSTYSDYDYKVASCVPPISDNSTDEDIQFSTALNSYNGLKPLSVVAAKKSDKYRGTEIANVMVSPVQYDMSSNKLRVYSMLQYKVTYNKSKARLAKAASLNADNSDVSGSLLVSDSLYFRDLSILPSGPIVLVSQLDQLGYLIVTVPRYEHYLKKFVQWKKMLGFNVEVAYNECWTPESIKEAVQKGFENNSKLLYVLFVGDNDQVPGQLIEKTVSYPYINDGTALTLNEHLTDRYYCCIDGDDDTMPDFYYGRWAVSNEEELQCVIDKTIQYEQQPTDDEKFYKTGINCAYFQPLLSNPYMESNRFIRTSEEVYDYMHNNQNKDVDRVYWYEPRYNESKGFMPLDQLLYNKSLGSSPFEVSTDTYNCIIRNDDFNALIDSINDGRFYTLYKGHGFERCMYTVTYGNKYEFNTSDLSKLDNYGWPTVFFNITCLTGKYSYSEKCIAEGLIDSTEGGAVGVIAATERSVTPYSDALTHGIFNTPWPSPGLSHSLGYIQHDSINENSTAKYRLGQILEGGIQKMSKQFASDTITTKYMSEIYHCFGDPSLMMATEVPTSFTGCSVKRIGNYVIVDLDEAATISLYDQTANTVYRYSGRCAEYKTDTPENVTVTVSGHNKVPYIDYGADYTPDGSELTESSNKIISVTDNSGIVSVKYSLAEGVKSAMIVAVDLVSNHIDAEVPCSSELDTVGVHIGCGYYAISLMIDGYPADTVRVVISK